jgi:hypothetical protein
LAVGASGVLKMADPGAGSGSILAFEGSVVSIVFSLVLEPLAPALAGADPVCVAAGSAAAAGVAAGSAAGSAGSAAVAEAVAVESASSSSSRIRIASASDVSVTSSSVGISGSYSEQ